jgi:hypothetical protein
MKVQIFSTALVAAFLLCGCSIPKFTKYSGIGVIQGKGGEVRTVDGIDIWEHGEPARKYEILGTVDGIPRPPGSDASPFFSTRTGILPSPKSQKTTAETQSFSCD